MDTIHVAGNVGSVEPLRTVGGSNGDTQVLNFSVASNRRSKDANGQTVTKTVWYRMAIWGNFAAAMAPYLTVGKVVSVVGYLKFDPETGGPAIWNGDNGPRARYEFENIYELALLGGKSSEAQADSGNSNDIPF